jgi:hypothetical protein
MLQVKVFANDDDVIITIKPTVVIIGCRGFAIIKEVSSRNKPAHEETLETSVGFEANDAALGRQKSTIWPVQRLIWTDYNATIGQTIKYKVIPMVGSADNLQQDLANASDWSNTVVVGSSNNEPFRPFFNRGVVASQWLAKKLAGDNMKSKLAGIIGKKDDPIRQQLCGSLGWRMFHILDDIKAKNLHFYAALFELDDPVLIEKIKALGMNAHLILCNGTKTDENIEARNELKNDAEIFDRLLPNGHLGHNKFFVIAEHNGNEVKPKAVWTGSTNWTITGLCTQANNGLLIENEEVASIYFQEWQNIKQAQSIQDDNFKTQNESIVKSIVVKTHKVTSIFTPVSNKSDLEIARNYIKNAKQGVLFLMFDPGTNGLLNDINDLDGKGLFIHGVVNSDPRSRKSSRITLFNRGTALKSDPQILVPKGIPKGFGYWAKELSQYNIVRVHSKVIVIDPFGEKPVVMTGSHNLSLKASQDNDDNLMIIENAPKLAEAYAVNILSIYDNMKWRFNLAEQEATAQWKGLKDNDTWMNDYINGPQMDEVKFWNGEYVPKL